MINRYLYCKHLYMIVVLIFYILLINPFVLSAQDTTDDFEPNPFAHTIEKTIDFLIESEKNYKIQQEILTKLKIRNNELQNIINNSKESISNLKDELYNATLLSEELNEKIKKQKAEIEKLKIENKALTNVNTKLIAAIIILGSIIGILIIIVVFIFIKKIL